MSKIVKPAFSRKFLNIIIFVCMLMILAFSQFWSKAEKDFEAQEQAASDQHNNNLQESDDQVKASQPVESKPAQTEPAIKAQQTGKALESMQVADFFPELQSVPDVPEAELEFAVESWTTENGMKALFRQTSAIPMVDIRLVFRAGAAMNTPEDQGLAQLTSALLGMGADGLNSDDVASGFEALGASFSTGSYQDMALASLRSLSDAKYLKEGVSLFKKVISEPTFEMSDFERQLARRRIAIQQASTSPAEILSNAAYARLFPDHPYGREEIGTLDTLNALKPDAVAEFFETFYRPRNGVIALVGDLSLLDAKKLAEEISRSFSKNKSDQQAPLPQKVKPMAAQSNEPVYIDFPSQQSHVLLLSRGVERGSKDYYSLYMANHILGGSGFASRLNKSIRQDRGLAYSVGSFVQPMTQTGVFGISLQTRGDQVEQALDVTQNLIEDFATNGPSQDEIEFARQQIISEFFLKIASNSSQLGYLGSIGFYDLPLDYVEDFQEQIVKVSPEDVQRVVKKYMLDVMQITVVGEAPKESKAADSSQTTESKQAKEASSANTTSKTRE